MDDRIIVGPILIIVGGLLIYGLFTILSKSSIGMKIILGFWAIVFIIGGGLTINKTL